MYIYIYVYICIYIYICNMKAVKCSLLPLRIVETSNFDRGLHNFIKLKKKEMKIINIELLYKKLESTVDIHNEKQY